ncbi:hypothetical protein FRB95_005376 [Tulasnella sp. JGI-2019a]|nr:hypothetical protein FRB95_005376 [Tulasnella sp. JGI-2019a]
MAASNSRTKYLHIIVLILAIVFAGIELWHAIVVRSDLDQSNATSTFHRLDFLIACSVWTIACCILLIVLSLAIGGEHRGLQAFSLIYFIITAVAWLVGATLWQHEISDRGCDLGHNECNNNTTIQSIAWAEMLKHIFGTLGFLWRLFRANKEKNNRMKGNYIHTGSSDRMEMGSAYA